MTDDNFPYCKVDLYKSNKKSGISIGEQFPELELHSTKGFLKLPKEFKRKWFVLFTLIADFTPVCTTELAGFNDIFEKLEEMDCVLLSLSFDQVYSHIKWIEWIKQNLEIEIKFPILAGNNKTANMLGLFSEFGNNLVRATYIVDPKGIVRSIHFYPQEIGRFPEEIVRSMNALQVAIDDDVLMPVNWPENAMLGRKVLMRPPTDEDSALEAMEQHENHDWWFCYKSLEYE
ncbi:MAG: peroxiredoxin [Candidatus Lokiarchaeota archaeon]|nr:peroxiredoxin [Candidatus Lokiarchaeota archaeon]